MNPTPMTPSEVRSAIEAHQEEQARKAELATRQPEEVGRDAESSAAFARLADQQELVDLYD